MSEICEKTFNKKIKNITDNIINMFNEELSKRKESEKRITPQVEETKQNLKEKETCISKLAKILKELEHTKAKLQKEVTLLKIEGKEQKEILKRLEKNWNAKECEYRTREQELTTASQTLVISTKDKEVLEIDRIKLSTYMDFTNVVWDYSIPLHHLHIVGYVQNSKHGYIQAFNYNTSKIAKAEITEKLWQEVENGIAGDWENLGRKKVEQENLSKIVQENII